MIIYWLSRHPPLKVEVDALKAKFGSDCKIIQDPNPVDDVDDIIKRFRESGASEIVVVLPYSLIHKLIQRGISPLMPIMEEVKNTNNTDYDLIYRGKKLRFVEFRRLKDIKLIYEKI